MTPPGTVIGVMLHNSVPGVTKGLCSGCLAEVGVQGRLPHPSNRRTMGVEKARHYCQRVRHSHGDSQPTASGLSKEPPPSVED